MQLLFCECTGLCDIQAIDFGGGQEQFENGDQVFSVLFFFLSKDLSVNIVLCSVTWYHPTQQHAFTCILVFLSKDMSVNIVLCGVT